MRELRMRDIPQAAQPPGKSPMQTGSAGAYTDSGLPRSEAGVSASDSAGSEHAADTSDGQSEFAMGDIIDSIFSDDD